MPFIALAASRFLLNCGKARWSMIVPDPASYSTNNPNGVHCKISMF